MLAVTALFLVFLASFPSSLATGVQFMTHDFFVVEQAVGKVGKLAKSMLPAGLLAYEFGSFACS